MRYIRDVNETGTIQETMQEELRLISKTALAKNLNVSIRTIHNYHDLAFTWIDDFETDYPLGNDGMRYSRAPMTVYQAWVIQRLIKLGATYPRKIFKNLINASAKTLSKEYFLSLQNQPTQQEDQVIDCQLLTA